MSNQPLTPGFAASLHDAAAALREELRSRGYYERPVSRYLLAWAAHFVIAGVGLVGFIVIPSTGLRIAALLVSCFGFLGLATLGHTASHQAASAHRLWNQVMLYVTYPFILQLSATFWHRTHVQIHHSNPNVVGIDNDCDLRPFFAINERHQLGASRLKNLYWKYQWVIFPFLLCINTFNIQRKGWQFLFRQLADPKTRSWPVAIDLGCMTLHLVVFLGLPMLVFAPGAVIGLYAVRSVIIGFGLFGILAPGHFPAEAQCLDQSQNTAGDFFLRQTLATVNFRTGLIGRFVCSGLEYQIEHHLFPGISHVHYPKVSPLVRDFCARQKLTHTTLGWPEAIWKSYQVFFTPKAVHDDVEALRERLTAGSVEAGMQ